MAPPSMAGQPFVLWSEPFDVLDPLRWREIDVKRRTDYAIVDLEGRRCLKAHSRDGASILISPVGFDPSDHKWLSWEWRVDRLVEGEALRLKRGSDAPARLYVYFKSAGLPWQKRNLDYVWSSTLPVGTVLESPYSDSSKIIVVESGSAALGQWRRVERNLHDDYRRCFMEEPPPVVAIGVMNDTDNTHSEALAYFDELRIAREPFVPSAGRRPADELLEMDD
ncbi:MAG: DUF3047 domain-containing protein [Candidatus Omnitrophica bacterium]|nr:DUF3047 domain-containing protein [Candidatus Omnitrophota bacterium]